MSLRFVNSSSDRVDTTTDTASFPDVCTILAWIFPTTIDATYQVIVEKTPLGFADYRGVGINNTTGSVDAFMRRATTDIDVSKAALLVANKWQFIGVQMDASGTVAADQKIFYGLEQGLVSEIGTYSIQNAGSGATFGSTFSTLKIANTGLNDQGFPGLIHCVAIWNRKMDISEIRFWKKMMQQGKFKPSHGNALFMYLGRDTGSQRDLSGSNFHGTITGALPVASRPTVSERFFAPWAGTVAAGGGVVIPVFMNQYRQRWA